ncbi:unnamed protein product [Arctia plantaginis]|uniref:Androgen-dependent TFPI-regulating protein-like n=1 Tax=Arctia plantaginis TaxID=874455 RepID=A0A8S1AA33_ARCPL|nr:unnamed protein product [Arctia plantaginis]
MHASKELVSVPREMYYIYFRILAYLVTIVLHIGNATWMITKFYGDVMKNPHVKHFYEMQFYFFTCWTFTFQIIHAAVALYSDILTLKNLKHRGYRLPKMVTDCRDLLYTILVWPATVLVVTMFWSFWFYDRNLLYPEDIDLAISSVSNHIMHTSIFFIALWEMMFRPRVPPRSHTWHLLSVMGIGVIYFGTVVGVYVFKGVFVYPIFGHLMGTIYFYLFFAGIATALFFIYHAQWILNDFLWGSSANLDSSAKISDRQNGENFVKKVK